MKTKVVIIIPTYNESQMVEETINQVFKSVQDSDKYEVHLLIFDSASQDETPIIVARLQKIYSRLHLQTEPQKSGLGSAYYIAMVYAMNELDADIVVEFDADLSHQPKYLIPMLEKMEHYDVVMGSRYTKGGRVPSNWGWYRKLLSKLGSYTGRLFLAREIKDFTSGFRATRTTILRKILPKQFISPNFAYKLELLYLLHLNKAQLYEMPIDFIDRYKGKSKMGPLQIVDSLKVVFQLRWARLTQYFVMCGVGITGMLVQVLVYNMFRMIANPLFATNIAVTMALINNYILNNRYTFTYRNSSHIRENKNKFALYILYSCFIIILQGKWLKFTLYLYGSGFWKENLLVFCGIVLGSVINYFVFSKVIWKYCSRQT